MPEIIASKENTEFAENILKAEYNGKKIIGIAVGGGENPGQEMHIKRWPKENYIKLIKTLKKNHFILLFGGNSDEELSDDIVFAVGNGIMSVAGKTTIQQSIALMKKCSLFITHDCGALCLASTVNIPLIALFGPTDPKRFAPKNAVVIKSKTKCSPCYDVYGKYGKDIYKECRENCMESIKVEDVIKTVNHHHQNLTNFGSGL